MRVAITGTTRGLGKAIKNTLCARWVPVDFNRPQYDISTKEGRKKNEKTMNELIIVDGNFTTRREQSIIKSKKTMKEIIVDKNGIMKTRQELTTEKIQATKKLKGKIYVILIP